MQGQSDQDEWLSHSQDATGNIFQKTVVDYSNKVIEHNINKSMENPIYKPSISDFQDDQADIEQNEMLHDHHNQNKEHGKEEALYNPLEDDQNERWTKKHCRKTQKPLHCPSCFNQLSYNYSVVEQEEKSIYTCKQVFGVVVRENKVIRAANICEKMAWQGIKDSKAEHLLKQREQAINIKILAQCECKYEVGYFDINKDSFVLINVI